MKLIRDYNFDEEQMRFVEYLRNVEDILYCEEEIKNSHELVTRRMQVFIKEIQ